MELASDARGNRIARHSVGEDLDAVIETWAYDTADRLVAHRRPHDPGAGPGPATTYSYDPDHGWLTTIVDATGRVETRSHDHDGALRSETHTGAGLDTITVERFRDARGRVSARRDTTGTAAAAVTAWAYTRDGRQAAVTHPGARIIGYEWNLDGSLATVTHSDGAQRRYGRDSMGRVTTVAVAPTPTGVGVPLATLGDDDDGRPISEVVHAAGGSSRLRGDVQDFLWDTTGGLPRVVDSYLYGALHARHDLTNQYLSIELDLGAAGTLLQWYGNRRPRLRGGPQRQPQHPRRPRHPRPLGHPHPHRRVRHITTIGGQGADQAAARAGREGRMATGLPVAAGRRDRTRSGGVELAGEGQGVHWSGRGAYHRRTQRVPLSHLRWLVHRCEVGDRAARIPVLAGLALRHGVSDH